VVFNSQASNLVTTGAATLFIHDTVTGTTENAVPVANLFPSSGTRAISDDGRFIVFSANASDMLPGGGPTDYQAYRYDRQDDELQLVSESESEQKGNGFSFQASITPDGRHIGFLSYADNLVAGDTNGVPDIFRKDLATGEIDMVSTSSGGTVSNDTIANVGPAMSADGSLVVFSSLASNLVAGDSNASWDVFIKELAVSDVTPPTVSNLVFSANPKAVSETSTLTADVTDDDSGVQSAEYFIGTDPGQGSGIAMTLGSGTASTVIGTDLAPAPIRCPCARKITLVIGRLRRHKTW
jgi:Tol biopolymer transport system component